MNQKDVQFLREEVRISVEQTVPKIKKTVFNIADSLLDISEKLESLAGRVGKLEKFQEDAISIKGNQPQKKPVKTKNEVKNG